MHQEILFPREKAALYPLLDRLIYKSPRPRATQK